MPLPTPNQQAENTFSAGDTSYIPMVPDWDPAQGYPFQDPRDIIVGTEGYLFLADYAGGAVYVLERNGGLLTGDEFGNDFSVLQHLTAPDDSSTTVHPLALAQDDRLNLFLVDSSNRIYVWSQLLTQVGVEARADSVLLETPAGTQHWSSRMDSLPLWLDAGERLLQVAWGPSEENWTGLRLFWDGRDSLSAAEAAYYYVGADTMTLTGIAAGPYGSDVLYAADGAGNSILEFRYEPCALVRTGTGDSLLVYRGRIAGRRVSRGTGNGTANLPRGLTVDDQGALYYAQWGPVFGVHKVGGSGSFELGLNDIMDLDRFDHPTDVALDVTGHIYVADTGHRLVQRFTALGEFEYFVGVTKQVIDTVLVDSAYTDSGWVYTAVDTVMKVYIPDQLRAPYGVAIDNQGVVYVVDRPERRVRRYQLSTELDYQP